MIEEITETMVETADEIQPPEEHKRRGRPARTNEEKEFAEREAELNAKIAELQKKIQESEEKKPAETAPDPNKELEKKRLKDKTPIRGQFHFHEVRGGTLNFVFKMYDGEPVEKYKLTDGQICTLPLGVVRHLMTSGKYPVYKHEKVIEHDEELFYAFSHWMYRYSFSPTDFIADEDVQKVISEQSSQVSFQR